MKRAGISKADSLVDIGLLEACLREELNKTAQRRIAVIDPVRLVVTNYPEGKTEYFDLPNNPEDPDAGTRSVPFTRELFVERTDYMQDPPSKFFRLKPGGEVRLMGAYIVRCDEAIYDENGTLTELHCTADLETGNGNPADGRKVRGTVHWLSAEHSFAGDVMEYGRLFTIENVNDIPEGQTYDDYLNPESLVCRHGCRFEESLRDVQPGERFQFVRTGYFTRDSKNSDAFNRIVTLKDSFPKK